MNPTAGVSAEAEHLQCLLDSPHDLVFTVDRDGRFLHENEAVRRLIARSGEELARLTVFDLALPECRRYLESCFARALDGAGIHGIEATFVSSGGMHFVLEGSASACWQRGEAHVHGIFKDITLRKEAEEAMAKHVEELTRSNLELEQLAYVAAHDMQEPLRMIASYLSLLERRYGGRLEPDAHEFIGFAVDGSNRLSQMVRDLLASARVVYSGKLAQPVDTGALMSRVAAALKPAIDEVHGQVSWDPLPVVDGNPIQLAQLMQNLVGNALKYRRDEPPRVHVSATESETAWTFAVADNGMGIPPEHTERVFRLFRRLHPRDRVPGAGIGLAVAKKIVERHGGQIWVESEPGMGSTFHFTIAKAGGRA